MSDEEDRKRDDEPTAVQQMKQAVGEFQREVRKARQSSRGFAIPKELRELAQDATTEKKPAPA